MLNFCSTSLSSEPTGETIGTEGEETLVTLRLPEPDDVRLERSPLALVVCQVRHDRTLAVSDARTALEVQKKLDGYPNLAPRQSTQATLAVVPDGAPALSHEQTSGWQLQSAESNWTVTLDPEFFSIETNAYLTWADFRARVHSLAEAVLATYAPALEVRLGLRYVDQITDPEVTEPTGWRGWIRDELLGPIAHDDFASAICGIQQIIEFDAEDGYRVVLRHGTNPTGSADAWVYVLDHDCFRQSARELTVDGIVDAGDDLHRLAKQIFQASITSKLYEYLGPVDAEAR